MDPRAPGLPRRIDALLFDAGGVLLDLDYAFLARLVEARQVKVTTDDLCRAESLARLEVNRTVSAGGRVSHAWREYFRIILRQVEVPSTAHEEIIDSLWSAHQRVGLWTQAVDGASRVLRGLKQAGFRMGVVSNAEGNVARDLDRAGFDGLFETVVDSHHVGVEKPNPAIFAIALENMRLDAGSTLFLGDLPAVDVAGARAAGLAPVLLDRHDLYPGSDAPRLRSIDELPALLDRDQRNCTA